MSSYLMEAHSGDRSISIDLSRDHGPRANVHDVMSAEANCNHGDFWTVTLRLKTSDATAVLYGLNRLQAEGVAAAINQGRAPSLEAAQAPAAA